MRHVNLVGAIVLAITLTLLATTLPQRVIHGDVSLQSTVITSSTYHPGYEAYNALDNDPSTFWHSEWESGNTLPQWIQLDLGDTYNVNQLSYLPRQDHADGRIRDYAVLLSIDGTDFFTVTSGTWSTETMDLQTALFSVTSARYVMLKALSAHGGNTASVAETSAQNVLDLCSALHPTSSSEHPEYEAFNAADNDPGTFWQSEWETNTGHLPQWIQLNLRDTYNVNQLSYLPRQDQKDGRMRDYAVLLSADGTDFFTATSGTWLNSPSLQTVRFPATDTHYVRLVALSNYGTYSTTSVAETSVQQTEANLITADWTTQASSHHSGCEARRAIDNDIFTYWHSEWETGTWHLPQWIEIDLGDIYNINQLSYLPRQDHADGRIEDYVVLLSVNGTDFFTVTSGTWSTDTRNVQTATFPPLNVRYARLVAHSGHEGGASAAQVHVGNEPGTTIPNQNAQACSQPGHEAYNAVDNNPSTFWYSEWETDTWPFSQWIQLDLGGIYNINQLSYLPRQDHEDGRIEDYAVLSSVDGTNFFTATSGTWSNSTSLQTARFPTIDAHYVRLVALSNYGAYSTTSAAETSVQGAGSVPDTFWGNRSLATAVSFPNYQIINLPDSSYTHTYRVYVKPREYGAFNWSVWFGNQVDNEPVHGQLKGYGINGGGTARTNDPGGSWRVVSAYWADGGTNPDGSIYGEPITITFRGNTFKDVEPLERFWSDPVRLNISEEHYLAFSWTINFGAGKTVPFSLQHQGNCYWKEGLYANQSDNVGFQLAQEALYFAVAPNLFVYEKDVGKRIGFLGDSITQGFWGGEDFWVSLIADGLGPQYGVWNLGAGFGHAYDVATNGAWLAKAVLNDEVAICLGVNDIDQRRTSDQILADLTNTISKIKSKDPNIAVILFTVPPFNFTGDKEQVWRTVNNTIRNDATTVLGADYVFDMADALSQAPPDENLIIPAYAVSETDHHPNPEGAQAVADTFLDWYDATLSQKSNATVNTLYSVSMISTSLGCAVGKSGTILSRENGLSWQLMSSPTTRTLYSVSRNGWVAVGENGTILSQFTDHLVPWYIETSPITETLYSVAMTSTAGGTAVGAGGTILSRVSDQPWEVETSPTTNTLYAVSVISDCGVAVGDYGVVTSRCHGQPWQVETSPTTKTLYSVAMASAAFGKAVGKDGVILSRADGQPWQVETSPMTRTLYSVIIVQDDGYWAVGEGGTILHYPFHGPDHDTWQILASPTDETLYSVSGPRCCKWAVGVCGMIVNNNSETGAWQIEAFPLCNRLYLPVILRSAPQHLSKSRSICPW